MTCFNASKERERTALVTNGSVFEGSFNSSLVNLLLRSRGRKRGLLKRGERVEIVVTPRNIRRGRISRDVGDERELLLVIQRVGWSLRSLLKAVSVYGGNKGHSGGKTGEKLGVQEGVKIRLQGSWNAGRDVEKGKGA